MVLEKNKSIVITGGDGFLGKRVAAEFKRHLYANIAVPKIEEYDLRKKADIIRLFDKAKPDMIIHLAAVVGGIGYNRDNPGTLFYDNLIMGIELIEQARIFGVQKVVSVGTICAYPKFTPAPFREEDLWNGYPEETNAPYGLAKKMLLVQSQAYRRQYGLNAIFLLPVNLYGPCDNFDPKSSHVIPAIIKKCFDAKKQGLEHITLWGDGTPTREFLFVDDCAEAIFLASQNYDGADPVNIGSGFEISIKDLASLIADHCGYRGKILWDAAMPAGQPRRLLDVTKAEKEFGFRAKTSLKEGLDKTVKWYLQTQEKAC